MSSSQPRRAPNHLHLVPREETIPNKPTRYDLLTRALYELTENRDLTEKDFLQKIKQAYTDAYSGVETDKSIQDEGKRIRMKNERDNLVRLIETLAKRQSPTDKLMNKEERRVLLTTIQESI